MAELVLELRDARLDLGGLRGEPLVLAGQLLGGRQVLAGRFELTVGADDRRQL